MTRLGGMKLSEFNAIVKQMKGIYPFKYDEATIVSIHDPNMGDEPSRLEIFTKDEKIQAGLLVNSTVTLAQLINKELKLND